MPKNNLLLITIIVLLHLGSQAHSPPFNMATHFEESRMLKYQKTDHSQELTIDRTQPSLQNQDPFADPNFLKEVQYTGTYHSLSSNKPFDCLDSTEGLLQSIIFENTDWNSEPTTQFNAFGLQLYDPVYHDRGFVLLILKMDNRTGDGQWIGVNSQAQYAQFWKARLVDQGNKTVNFTMNVKNIRSQQLNDITIDLYVKGNNFEFRVQLKYDNERGSIITYCMYTTLVVAIQIFFLWRVLSKIDGETPHLAHKISLTTVSICNIMDFYLTIIHIQYIIASVSSYYMFYIFPAMAYIILFIVYDMKLLFLVWRSHTLRQIDNPQDLRKNLTVFYVKFYLGLFIYLALVYFFIFDEWFIICQNLVLIPQIIRNARIGNNPGFQPAYVIGYLTVRFFMPFYERLCPANHFLLMPMVGVVIALAILYIIQIVILFLQSKVGPRFFIPRILQPDFFDYRAKIKYNEDTKQLECAICLLNFFDSNTNIQGNQSSLSSQLFQEQSVMKTPCNHYFHKDCLVSWADVKLECPTCRAPLPPL